MKVLVALLAAAAALMAGCKSEPIYEVAAAPVAIGGKSLSMDQVTQAILRGGTIVGWQMNPEQPGRMTARYVRGRHTATVDVTYDVKTFSIKHRDSSLGGDSGNVHRVYNNWVQSLDRSIRAELLHVSK
jgi:hypothetical protein